MRLGSHLSTAKGMDKAVENAVKISANTFQMFTRNPRGGRARAILTPEIEKAGRLRNEDDINPVIGHLPYTVNMASPTKRSYDFASMVVAEDLQRMSSAGVDFIVVHPGSHAGSGAAVGIKRIVACLEHALAAHTGKCELLLETMSGQGSEIGTFAEIGAISSALGNPEKLGICLDSCHLTAAGYDFRDADQVKQLVEDIENSIGIKMVKAIHLNDSKLPPGSRKDRHELIGKGYLGKEGIVNFITHPALKDLPMVLETPVEDYLQYGEEIALIRSWLLEK